MEQLWRWWERLHPWVVVKFGKSSTELSSVHWTRVQANVSANEMTTLATHPKKGLPSGYRSVYRVMTREEWWKIEAQLAKGRAH